MQKSKTLENNSVDLIIYAVNYAPGIKWKEPEKILKLFRLISKYLKANMLIDTLVPVLVSDVSSSWLAAKVGLLVARSHPHFCICISKLGRHRVDEVCESHWLSIYRFNLGQLVRDYYGRLHNSHQIWDRYFPKNAMQNKRFRLIEKPNGSTHKQVYRNSVKRAYFITELSS